MKRFFDMSFAIIALIFMLLPLLFVGIAVRLKFGAPVFFRQLRPGLNGEPFLILKFRTMTSECDLNGNLLPDEKRLTPFGRFLRSTSLDEAPEIWNVLKGEMSFVGPRPLLMEYLPLYSPEQARRHEVRPGVTGWAQVNGRNALGWEEKFKLDIWYVEHRNFCLDLYILFLTVCKVLARDGINERVDMPASKFKGNKL